MKEKKERHSFIKRDIIVVIVTLLAVSSVWGAKTFFENRLSGQEIQHTLMNISTLNSAEYHYTHVESYDSGNRKILWDSFEIPLSKSEGVYSYDGKITAGIDFSQIEVNIDNKNKSIIISLPKSDITGSELDTGIMKSYYEKNNLFNPMNAAAFSNMIEDIKKEEEDKAKTNGLLTWADNNAQNLIKNFIENTYDTNSYEIEFKTK